MYHPTQHAVSSRLHVHTYMGGTMRTHRRQSRKLCADSTAVPVLPMTVPGNLEQALTHRRFDKRGAENLPANRKKHAPEPGPTADQPGGSLQITSAEWLDSRSRLTARGTGEPGQVVAIYNGDNMGDHYGAVLISGRGAWKFRMRKPSPVPGRVLAICNGDRASSTVCAVHGNGLIRDKMTTRT